jgi:tRNA threonylcarbamoyladenosine biosynthesis protein TsaE
MIIDTRSAEETIDVGTRLGIALEAGDVVGLVGDLGAGKTHFVKGLALGLGVGDARVVTSPTFVLMNSYEGRLPLRHYDLYRLDAVELESLAYFDLRTTSAIVVEWAEKAGEALGERLDVLFETTGATTRRLTFRPAGGRGIALLNRTFGEISR